MRGGGGRAFEDDALKMIIVLRVFLNDGYIIEKLPSHAKLWRSTSYLVRGAGWAVTKYI